MRKLSIALAALAVAGCTNLPRHVGSKAYDEALEQAEWLLCEAASVGSVKRRYRTQAEYDAYLGLCAARFNRDASIARTVDR